MNYFLVFSETHLICHYHYVINHIVPCKMSVRKLAFSSVSCQRCCIDRSGYNCKRTRSVDDRDEDRGRIYKCAELVSRRCTLIRLLCTVIGCDIRPFTRFAEQMEANRGRRSCTEFSLVLGHQLVTRRQVSRSQINVLSVDKETLHVLYDSQYSNQILMVSCDYCIWLYNAIKKKIKKVQIFLYILNHPTKSVIGFYRRILS